MIIDHLSNSALYSSLHPGIAKALAFLVSTDTAKLSPGRHPIAGDDIFAIVDECQGNGKVNAKLEIHKKYIDVQFVEYGEEWMGWSPFSVCSLDHKGYDSSNDLGFCEEKPEAWFHVKPGYFTIFYPNDAHAPLAGTGQIRKIIVKVAV